MIWPFKSKNPEPVAVEEKSANGFFSTDYKPKKKSAEILSAAYSRTFGDAKLPTPSSGVMPDGTIIAMDDGDSLQFHKRVTQFANTIPEAQIGWYASQGFIGYSLCAIIGQQWLVDKACTMPARDAIRKGYEITVNDGTEVDPDIMDQLKKADKVYKLDENMVEFVRQGRVFGIRIALFKVESADPEYYFKPFNPDGITPNSYKGIAQIDPYWVTPELDFDGTDPSSINFYEPTWWRVNGVRYHKTHLIIFRNSEVSDILKPVYMYGGMSVPQKIAERVYAAERTANEAPQLAMTKRTTTIHVDMAKVMANQIEFEDNIATWARWRDNHGIKVLGLEETMEQFDTSLADLDATIMTQYQLVAAAAEVPSTKLMGTQPKGFNSTGEYEESSYHEMLESIQTSDLTPFIDRHHLLLIRSEIAPNNKINPFSTTVNWHPLDTPTAKEVAELNKIKAETDQILVNAGAIDGQIIQGRIINDPKSGYNGLSLDEMPDEEEAPDTDINPDDEDADDDGQENKE